MTFLIGEVAERLAVHLRKCGCETYVCGDIKSAFASACEKAVENSTILLSPGFSSLDQFDNYQHRGSMFEDLVTAFKNEKSTIKILK